MSSDGCGLSSEEEDEAAASPMPSLASLKPKPKPIPKPGAATAAELAAAEVALSAAMDTQLAVFNSALIAALAQEVEQPADSFIVRAKIHDLLLALGALRLPPKRVVKNHEILPTLRVLRKHDCIKVSALTKKITACWQQLWNAPERLRDGANSSVVPVVLVVGDDGGGSRSGGGGGGGGDGVRAVAGAPGAAGAPAAAAHARKKKCGRDAASPAKKRRAIVNVQLKPTLCKRRRESVEMLAKCIALGRSLSSASCKDRAAAREVRVCVEMWIARVHPPLPSPPRWLHHVTAERFSSPTLIFLSPAASHGHTLLARGHG